MQEEITSPSFEKACMFPCDILAATIEMEHRKSGRPRNECMEDAAKVLADKCHMYEEMPTELLFLKSLEIELTLMGGVPHKESGDDENAM